jgi:alpha-aminoadipate/glutamate carrier protein LysW
VSATAMCPECEYPLDVGDITVGETLACPECGLTLQVVDRTPSSVQLEMIETELPDWGE